MVLAFGMMSFTTSEDFQKKIKLKNFKFNSEIVNDAFCDYYWRKCRYIDGVKYCSAWECVIVLEEVVIEAN